MSEVLRPRLLILSFSDIASDARILKQIALFKDCFTIVTCGFGSTPPGVARHLRIPAADASLKLDGRLITLRQYRLAYWSLPAVRAMLRLTRPFRGTADLVIANEAETVPIALKLRARFGVLADLHEYTPSLQEHLEPWRRRIKPYMEWLVRTYVAKADGWTSPSDGVGTKYQEEFGFLPLTVMNAAPYHDLSPTAVGKTIRFVHHGGAQRNRSIHTMIEGFQDSSVDGTFDLFLMPNDPDYLRELKEMVEGDDRVFIHQAIAYPDLISTLNSYDVGIHVLPPVNFNNRWALPNKLFDFTQARLGQVIGPNPEMRRIVEHNSLGVITRDYSSRALTEVLDGLDAQTVQAWKEQASQKAEVLSEGPQSKVWAGIVADLMAR